MLCQNSPLLLKLKSTILERKIFPSLHVLVLWCAVNLTATVAGFSQRWWTQTWCNLLPCVTVCSVRTHPSFYLRCVIGKVAAAAVTPLAKVGGKPKVATKQLKSHSECFSFFLFLQEVTSSSFVWWNSHEVRTGLIWPLVLPHKSLQCRHGHARWFDMTFLRN